MQLVLGECRLRGSHEMPAADLPRLYRQAHGKKLKWGPVQPKTRVLVCAAAHS